MITVSEAQHIIRANTKPLQPETARIEDAFEKVLAADVIGQFDIPAFPQSAMDGYAFCYNDWITSHKLTVQGESAAGVGEPIELRPGQAVRIFTGAAVPGKADTVVMQEKIKLDNGLLIVEDEKITVGANVRKKGAEIQAGDVALKKGTTLTPAAIGFLAGIGISTVPVFPFPRVGIIVTGNELEQPGEPLKYGGVYESNSFSLSAALQKINIIPRIFRAHDDLDQLSFILQSAINDSDVVLLTGGVSVGDYDFVIRAAEKCGVKTCFHNVKQRPGKPLFFGSKDHRLVFGLPGNPASVLTCFYEYVLEAMGILTQRDLKLKTTIATLEKPLSKAHPLTHFLKGYYDGHVVNLLEAQESFRMRTYAEANCLVVHEADIMEYQKGDQITIHLLPS